MVQKVIIITIGFMFFGTYAQGRDKVASYPVHSEFVKINKKPFTKGKICKVKTKKFGVIQVRGNSYEEAFSKGVESCFQKLNKNHIRTHKKYPGMDEQISFTRTCTNIECH